MITRVLRHLGIIPDGNRRWARKYNTSFLSAYKKGSEKIRNIIKWWISSNIEILSIYVLSRDNILKRFKTEVNIIYRLLNEYLKKEMNTLLGYIENNGIGVYFVGDLKILPEKISERLLYINKKSDDITPTKKLYLLLAYSGRYEIKRILENCPSNNFKEHLWIKEDVDLIFRTSGTSRLSDFLVYQSAYAEIYVTEKLWPDIEVTDIEKAVEWFYKVKRNFGR